MVHSAVLLWVRRGVGGDQGPVQVQGGEQLGQGRDLVGLVGHPPLCHDDSADLVQGRQQVRGWVVLSAGPAPGLTLHRDHPAAGDGAGARMQPGGQEGIEAHGVQVLQDPADGGLATAGPARPPAPKSAGRRPPGRWRAPRSPSDSHSRPGSPSRPDTGSRAGHDAPPPVPRIDHALKDLPQGLARGALVVEDDIAARPPVIEDDLDTTYRPGGAAPHPRQHAENPERQTTSHRLCRAPGGGGRRHTAGRRRPDVGREAPEPRERTAETAPCSIAGRGSAVRRSGREALIRWTMVHRSGRYNRRRSRGGCLGSRSTPP